MSKNKTDQSNYSDHITTDVNNTKDQSEFEANALVTGAKRGKTRAIMSGLVLV